VNHHLVLPNLKIHPAKFRGLKGARVSIHIRNVKKRKQKK